MSGSGPHTRQNGYRLRDGSIVIRSAAAAAAPSAEESIELRYFAAERIDIRSVNVHGNTVAALPWQRQKSFAPSAARGGGEPGTELMNS
jgi:hypothetical protein